MMEDREWMYIGRPRKGEMSDEWIYKTNEFLEHVFGEAAKGARAIFCPCSKCANRKRQTKIVMGKHLVLNGFTPDYTRWVYHGEAGPMREKVVRPRVEDYDVNSRAADMLNDYHKAQLVEGRTEEESEATSKEHKPLHKETKVSQLDAIGRIMVLKSQYSLSRDAIDGILTVIGSMLPEGHILPKSMYEAQKLLRALNIPCDQIHACQKKCHMTKSMAKEVHGPEYDQTNEDLSIEAVMKIEGGKKHGRYWIADDAIDSASTPTPSQIRARSTSASPTIRPQQEISQYQIQALQNQLEEERRQRVELEARMMAEQQRMKGNLTYLQSIGAATGVAPPPSLFATPGPSTEFSSTNQ